MRNFSTQKQPYTKEEYFALEETSEDKFEFENGEVFAMSGGTANHSLITGNIITALNIALGNKNCRVFSSDMKTAIDAAESYVYPDAQVICGKVEYAEGRNDIVTNPLLVVEVLSDSTERYDRGKKFKKYQTLSSFKEYVLISQAEPLVETFVRQDENHWLYTFTEGMDSVVQFPSIGVAIAIADIYRKVEFATE
ncbi:Uma2 family endonuclease [Rhodocytophaga rosea]|uniref:Uma2 family endonuclease n=1 Tax=Rhodocytophaga rosea TaxID=2704465 RepID=A0A6C0GQ46_9BACT|nr:Uma2 family endonuclease [Rhodocytophaga rosea]QHT69702.1 Uma2 family endonuclease [Rhodocytophaga rosea]